MQTATQLQPSQKSRVALFEDASVFSTPPGHSEDDLIMHRNTTANGSRPPLSSSNTTPTSTRRSSLSSLNNPNVSSASSDMSTAAPKRSSMKSPLRPSRSVGANLNRRSAPPTVRFLDPKPMPRRVTEPGKTTGLKSPTAESRPVRPGYARGMSTPNLGPHQYQQKKIMITTLTRPPKLSPVSKRASTASSPEGSASSPRTMSPAHSQQGHPQVTSRPVNKLRQRVDKRFSAPAVPSQVDPRLDPRWSGIPFPAGFVPPSRTPTSAQKTASYHSVVSNLSSPSTSPVPTPSLSNKYDPLQNYIPCMAAMCTAHYTPAHSGPTYYIAQEPYRLSKHHGYCPRHASKEMQEANALCKKEFENMRQNAGRKTLGVVAQDFEIFLQLYRESREVEDTRLQEAQRQKVLASFRPAVAKGKLAQSDGFEWRYTPRNCTKKGCSSTPYSPFSTQHYSFYHTPNSSTQLLPLSTLCPNCSKTEAESFGAKLMEKWSSRCGWDGEEWDGWYQNAIEARKAEQEFWEKAQERVVTEKLAMSATKSAAEKVVVQNETKEKEAEVEVELVSKKEKRQSIFKRIFRRNSTAVAPAAPAVATVAA